MDDILWTQNWGQVSADELRAAINAASEATDDCEFWCLACGAYAREPLCELCWRLVLLREGGKT